MKAHYLIALILLLCACSRETDIIYDDRFDFSRLDVQGKKLPEKTGPWACVQDNKSGLVWEVKADDESLRHYTGTFSWYDPKAISSRDKGRRDKGSCHPSLRGQCDTAGYIIAMNEQQLCGKDNWRLPTVAELKTLLEMRLAPPGPLVAPATLPNTRRSGYWTGDQGPPHSGTAWAVSFADGQAAMYQKSSAFYLRLVSD